MILKQNFFNFSSIIIFHSVKKLHTTQSQAINPTSPDGRDNVKDKAITISYFFIVKLKKHEYIRLFVVTILLE